ncbi:MAG: sulfotransferase family protein [Rhodobacteraceae bacterium]|nr:sulfotransferase family protein [Paracoccaceae bacterium]
MVLVSYPHRFIFIKTSKTAGTSVEMALEHACAPDGHVAVEKTPALMSEQGIIGSRIWPIELPPQPALEKGMWYNHKSAKEIRDDLGVERFARYLKITTVRNPFDRCVSAFHWLRKPETTKAGTFAELRQKFQEFILAEKWKTDKHNALIKGEFIIDRSLRFETLKSDLTELAKDLKIAVNINAMPHVKSTHETRKDYAVADYYNQACIDVVRRRSDWVFEHCDYPDHP